MYRKDAFLTLIQISVSETFILKCITFVFITWLFQRERTPWLDTLSRDVESMVILDLYAIKIIVFVILHWQHG